MNHYPSREPYVGTGADGCRRSAKIDRDRADTVPYGSSRWRALIDSADRWERKATELETRRWFTHTAPAPHQRIRAWVPCCTGQSITLQPPAENRLVQCRSCHATYQLTLVDEQDGGWGAAWASHPHLDVLITRRYGEQPA